jgi:GT2 family glycosyltransferase
MTIVGDEKQLESQVLLGTSIITINSGRNFRWLKRCIESVNAQETDYAIEHIIIDNVENKMTLGEAYNSGMGISNSRMPFIMILDDDDELHTKAVEEMINSLVKAKEADPNTYRVASYQMLINEYDESMGTTNLPCLGMFDKEMLKAVGGFQILKWSESKSPLVATPRTLMLQWGIMSRLKSVTVKSHLYAKRIHRGQVFFPKYQQEYEEILYNYENGYHKLTEEGLINYAYDEQLPEMPAFIYTAPRRNVAVGIVTYNNEDVIKHCLENVVKYSDPKSTAIFIFDNNSTDHTRDIVDKLVSSQPYKLNTKYSKENKGFAGGCNEIIEAVKTDNVFDHLILLNPDAYVSPNWIDYMINCAERNKNLDCGIVGIEELDINGNNTHNLIALSKNESKEEVYMNIGLSWNKMGVTPREIEVPAVTFSCVLLTRAVVDRVKFDENFKIGGYEDIDYCLQTRKEGYTIFSTPYVRVMHYRNMSWSKIGETAKGNYNYLLNKWKNDETMKKPPTWNIDKYIKDLMEDENART